MLVEAWLRCAATHWTLTRVFPAGGAVVYARLWFWLLRLREPKTSITVTVFDGSGRSVASFDYEGGGCG
jgi:hypothetical protein